MTYYTITWGKALLRAVGAPFNVETDKFLRAWAQAEGANAKWNPFATTQKLPGSVTTKNTNGTPNSAGVQDYVSWTQGVLATATTLLNGKYKPLVAALRAGKSADTMAAALANSPWGTGMLAQGILGSRKGPLDYPIGNCYPSVPTKWTRKIEPGFTGPDVDELLHKLGNTAKFYNSLVADGNMVARVKAHQKLRPWLWPADGIVGPKSYKSITGHA